MSSATIGVANGVTMLTITSRMPLVSMAAAAELTFVSLSSRSNVESSTFSSLLIKMRASTSSFSRISSRTAARPTEYCLGGDKNS